MYLELSFPRAPPSPATWTAGWWSSMQVSWQQSYSTRSRVQDVRLRYRSRLQSYQRGRVTCMVLRNKIWHLTIPFSLFTQRVVVCQWLVELFPWKQYLVSALWKVTESENSSYNDLSSSWMPRLSSSQKERNCSTSCSDSESWLSTRRRWVVATHECTNELRNGAGPHNTHPIFVWMVVGPPCLN